MSIALTESTGALTLASEKRDSVPQS
uniref:Uncharacterized protein n=1 Tax=uncultured myxobacterium HF0200_19H16 TaxID=723559 RepID=E7C3V5_9BACT|nr:hypothetical protein [uncultured myxobacterium HF0200_19H16]